MPKVIAQLLLVELRSEYLSMAFLRNLETFNGFWNPFVVGLFAEASFRQVSMKYVLFKNKTEGPSVKDAKQDYVIIQG